MQLDFEGRTKDEVAIERIKLHYNPNSPLHVAFSGGKDSVVIYDIAKRTGLPFVAEYKVTGIDPYQLVKFIKKEYPEVVRIRPEKTIWELIEWKQIPPLRTVRYCCEHLKEHQPDNSTIVTGVRWQESAKRKQRAMFEVCHKNKTVNFIHPIIDWAETEVWDYIKSHNLPYCELYDMGFRRLGCVLCPMHTKGMKKLEMQMFPSIVAKWKRAIEKLPRYSFNWWLYDEENVSDAQCTMFHD